VSLAVIAGVLALYPVPARASDEDTSPAPDSGSAAAAPAPDDATGGAPQSDDASPQVAAPDPLGAESVPAERGKFADVARTFFYDGAYLLTFPARATPRGVAMTAGWGGATLLALHNDDWIASEVSTQNEPERDHLAQTIEPLGRMPLQAGVLGILYASGKMADRPGLASTAATSFEALVWAGLISNTGKMIFGRDQPGSTMDARYFFEGQGSFPSGHAARSFAIAAVMANRYGKTGAWLGYGVAGLVSLSMVQREIHWASDVVAGAGLGLAIGKGIATRHPGPNADAALGGAAPRKFAWQVHPARDGAALTLVF
jgi:membrane-associated phospholipid phosphatase